MRRLKESRWALNTKSLLIQKLNSAAKKLAIAIQILREHHGGVVITVARIEIAPNSAKKKKEGQTYHLHRRRGDRWFDPKMPNKKIKPQSHHLTASL